MAMSKVVVFGSLNMDLSVEVKRMPRKGETLMSTSMLTTPGGKGGNQAVMCSRMGADTYMIAKVGNDALGQELVSSLQEHGVYINRVTVNEEAPTGTAMIIREPGDNRIIVNQGANLSCRTEEARTALRGLGKKGDYFLTQLECDFDVTMDAIVYAKELGMHTVCNAAPARPLTDEAYAALDLLCVNAIEAEQLVGFAIDDDGACIRALERFADKGVGATVITLGEDGSVTLIGHKYVKVPAYDVEVVDTTGAGDAYLGELVAHMVFGGELVESMGYATAAAALAVGKVGAQDAMPTWAEVKAFVESEGLNA